MKFISPSLCAVIVDDIETVIHVEIALTTGDQGGPCKASFAELIPHQTLKLKILVSLTHMNYSDMK